jgi:hypothetical protein
MAFVAEAMCPGNQLMAATPARSANPYMPFPAIALRFHPKSQSVAPLNSPTSSCIKNIAANRDSIPHSSIHLQIS